MPAVMRAAAVVEGAGVPAVAVGGQGFEQMGHVLGKILGIPQVPIVSYPGVIQTDTSAVFAQKVHDVVAPLVLEAIVTEREGVASAAAGEPGTREIVYRGSLDEVQAEFEARMWSDGLPIVPPTIDRVERFLAWTDRDPDEVIGVISPELREATVWNVAVNGVMSGCRPEYLPVLLAVVECIADPAFRVEDAGSTPGWEPLIVLSGDLVRQLEFNFGAGVLRVGRRANTSIGRFLRMYLRNVGGLRIAPGALDQGAIGSSFHVVLAEDDEGTRAAGWTPYRSDCGFDADANVVSVRSVVSVSPPIYSAGDSAASHLDTLSLMFANSIAPWTAGYGVSNDALFGLVVLGPTVAKALADFGVGKDELRQYVADRALVRADVVETQVRHAGVTNFNLAELVRKGQIPAEYAASDEPGRLVRMMPHPERIDVVVSGSAVRNQSRVFINNHAQGVPVAKAVRLPARWGDRS
jgi:hypothetical protein